MAERPHATGADPQPGRHGDSGDATSQSEPCEDVQPELLGLTPGGVCVLDAEGRCLAANHGASAAFGRPPGALVGQRLADVLPPHFADAYPALLADATCSGRGAATCAGNDGGRLRMTIWSLGKTDMTAERFVLVIDDVTQQELAEQALQDSQAKANALLQEGSALVAANDLTGLKNVVFQLQNMLPAKVAEQARRGYGSGLGA